jgi:predicted RNA-binding protein YlxR (DUF448 family)
VDGPERSCVGCRAKRAQADLIRLHVEAGRVCLAQPGSPGRSAYLCPDPVCLTAAGRRRAFGRAFRGPASVDEAFVDAFAKVCDERKVVR